MSTELDNLRKEYQRYQERKRKAQADNPLERVGRLQDELAAMTATASSANGRVTIVAGPGGSIRDIRLNDDAMQQSAAGLAAELRATVQQAVAEAARRQATLIDEHMGGQLGGETVYDQVMQNQADAFGTTVGELKQSLGQPPKPQAPKPMNEDDFSENTLMSKGHRPAPPTGSHDAGPPSPPAGGGGSRGDQFLKNLFGEE